MVVPDIKFVAKNGPKFCCEYCDYNTSKKMTIKNTLRPKSIKCEKW